MFRVGIKFPYHGLPRVCMIFVKDHVVISVLNMLFFYLMVSVLSSAPVTFLVKKVLRTVSGLILYSELTD
jgi:hypothetical protein